MGGTAIPSNPVIAPQPLPCKCPRKHAASVTSQFRILQYLAFTYFCAINPDFSRRINTEADGIARG